MGEGHAPRELLVVGVARAARRRWPIALGHDVRVRPAPRRAEHPLVVGEDAQPPRRVRGVGQREQRELHRVRRVHEDVELVADAAGAARERASAPAECRITKRPLSASRRIGPGVGDQASPVSSSRMKRASAVGSLTGSLANGVRRFSRLFSGPGVGGARRGDDGAEARGWR